MAYSKRVLFCYITMASGHRRAAEAIMGAVEALHPGLEPRGIDNVSYSTPVLGRLAARLYLKVLKHVPALWDYLYDNAAVEEATRDLRRLGGALNKGKIFKILKRHRPRCVVCTQAVPMTILTALKRRGLLRRPLVGVVTDFGVHGYWLSPETDLYLVPTEEVKSAMIARGISAARVRVTGLPIDPVFALVGDTAAERRRLSLDPARPVVLIMGGSHGLGPMDDMVRVLRRSPLNVQVVAVCGDNRRLRRRLIEEFARDASVHVAGQASHVDRLMDAADILVSKPGGLTCAEAMAKRLPMVILQPIPGQEERNAVYLTSRGAALRADSWEDLTQSVESLLLDPLRRERMRERQAAISRPWAAYEAAESILEKMGEPVLARPAEWPMPAPAVPAPLVAA